MTTYFKSAFDVPLRIPPMWLMRQAGRYLPEYRNLRAKSKSFVDFCLSPDLAAEATLQPIKRFDFDAAILFSDILMIPYSLGQDLWFVEGEGPKLGELHENLSTLFVLEKLKPVFETICRVRQELPPEKSFIGFAGGVWTVLCYMIASDSKDWHGVVLWAQENQQKFNALQELVCHATIAYLDKQIESGVDVIQIFDSWCSVVPEKFQEKWVIEPTYRIVSFLKAKYPGIKIIAFPKGFGNLEKYVLETGIDGISIDYMQNIDLDLPVVLQGNLSPELLVKGGDEMEKSVHDILEKTKNKRFIFNLGHGILPHTPIENVEKLIKLVRG